MQWVNSSIECIDTIDASSIIKKIEYACRTCYQSYDKITDDSAEPLIRSAIKRGHESVMEHQQLTFKVVCSRSCLAQWTRHRLASYSVESQRYCNYSKDKFGNNINFIRPLWVENEGTLQTLEILYGGVERRYFQFIKDGWKPEEARSILPQSTACTMIFSANLREIRHFIKLRSSKGAEPEIRKLAIELLQLLRNSGLSVFFEDIEV